MEVMQKSGYEFLKSCSGIAFARQLDLANRLNFGDNFLMVHGSNGLIYFGISDLINYFTLGQSKLLSGNVYGILDDIGFFGGVSGATAYTEVDKKIYDLLGSVSRDNTILEIATDSSILTGARMLGQYIDSNNVPTYLKYIRHPTALMKK